MHGMDAVRALYCLGWKDLDDVLLCADAFIRVFLAQVLKGSVVPNGCCQAGPVTELIAASQPAAAEAFPCLNGVPFEGPNPWLHLIQRVH